MAQCKINDFFSTRKRGRFNHDDVVLNKQKKTQLLIESNENKGVEEFDEIKLAKSKILMEQKQETTTRCTRSRAKQTNKNDEAPKPEQENKQEDTSEANVEQAPVRKTRNSAKKESIKAKINKFEYELEKVTNSKEKKDKDEPKEQPNVEPEKSESAAPQEETKTQEAPKEKEKTGRKKKVNMEELKKKIESFNQNLLSIQNNFDKSTQQAEPKEKVAEPEPAIAQVDANMPAYLKFKDLASAELDPSSQLTLPTSFKLLFEAFKGSDTIIKFLFNRSEVCTFLKLKMGIQNITKHTFTTKHLSQIKTVYPEAYIYKQEKMFIDFKNDYHLIITPNLDEIATNQENGSKQFSPGCLLQRLNNFKYNLIKIVKKYHQEFLESIGITNVAFDSIKRWHQKFDLEKVKEIEESELPKPPIDESIKCKTGQELLNIAKDIYSSRIQTAISKTVADQNKVIDLDIVKPEIKTEAKETKEANENLTEDQKVLAKLKEKKDSTYNALLEKVRNKEKQKAFETMVVNSDKEKTLVKYGIYKETVRLLAFYFQSEKKSVIEFDKVSAKLADNLKSKLSDFECRDMLKELTADGESNMFVIDNKKWLNMIKVRNVFYVQMDKAFQMNDLFNICDKAIEKLSN